MSLKYLWEDCTISFVCPKCGAELTADSQMGWDKCECGFEYCLEAIIRIKDKEE